jgi:hypothetical protein
MGALLGHSRPVGIAYDRFLQRYSQMLTHWEFKIDHVHGRHLGPSLITFHVQLAWRNWMIVQLDSGGVIDIDPPDFGAGLTMLETQNNLMWSASVTNVPLLLNLSLTSRPTVGLTRAPSPAPVAAQAATQARGVLLWITTTKVVPFETPPAMPCSLATPSLLRTYEHKSCEVIVLAGAPSVVVWSGATRVMRVSWHGRGQCYENFDRDADRGVLNVEEDVVFQAWCQVAYA